MADPLKSPYPSAGSFLIATEHAPAALHGRVLFIFFSDAPAGIMAWDLSTIDEDILYPVIVRRFRLEALVQLNPKQNRELLNGGPSTLEAKRERDFFLLHDTRPGPPQWINRIDDRFSYTVLTASAARMQTLEDMAIDRFLVMRGFMGIDAVDFNAQLAAGWWQWLPADPRIVYQMPPDERHGAIKLPSIIH